MSFTMMSEKYCQRVDSHHPVGIKFGAWDL